jgi:hypothetical protein
MKAAVLGRTEECAIAPLPLGFQRSTSLLVYTNLHTMSHCCARDGTAQGKPCDCVGFRVDIYG